MHGGAYVLFSQASRFEVALGWIALSRAAVAVSSVLNWSLLLRHVAHDYRGRVFATNESLVWSTMMLSMLAAGLASQSVDPRTIGAVSGVLSSCTAIYWIWADRVGLLKEPAPHRVETEDVEPHDPLTRSPPRPARRSALSELARATRSAEVGRRHQRYDLRFQR